MNSAPFKVSTKVLIFPKSKTATQTIEIQFEKENLNVLGVRMTHNLPKCFAFDLPSELIKAPSRIKITYNSKTNETIPETMYIKFSDKLFDANSPDAVTVVVKIVDENQKSEALECKVCLLQFSEDDEDLAPRLLTGCGHTLCEKCVKTITSQNGSIQCPFDRKVTNSTNNHSFQRQHQTLPKNFAIIEMLREKNESELMKKLLETEICDDPDVPCFENPKHEATCYCTECKAEFCQNCFNSTHSAKIFSSHKSIPIYEKPIVQPNCPSHPANLAKFLCKEESCSSESKLICDGCLLGEHELHDHENLMDTLTKNQEELKKIVIKLKSAEIKSQIKVEAAQSCVKSFEKSTSTYTEKVELIKKHFEKEKDEALKRLDNFMDSKTEKLEVDKEQIEHDLEMMTGIRREIEKMLKKKTNLHDVDEIIGKGEAICSLGVGNDEPLHPFTSYCIPNDVSIENVQVITFSNLPPSTPPPPCNNIREVEVICRRVMKANRKNLK